MSRLISFVKGLFILVVVIILVYYGLVLLNRWNYGALGMIAAIIIFPLVLCGAGYATELLTFKKLGSTASIFVSLFLLMCIGAVQKYNYEKDQMAGLQAAADALGLEYSRSVAVDSTLGSNPILRSGFLNTAYHALAGKYKDVDVMIFNYQYEELSGDDEDHYFRTVVVFADPHRDIPEFQMQSKSWGDRLFGLLDDNNEIEFPEDPEFSKRYYLLGTNQQAVRDLFGPAQRRTFVESERNWSIAGIDHRVIIYADDRMDEEVKPNLEEISKYLEQTRSLYEPIRSAAPIHVENNRQSP